MTKIKPGDEFDFAALQLHSTVLEHNDQVFRTLVEAGPGTSGGPLHRHLRQTERFRVQEGTLRMRTGLRGHRLVRPDQEISPDWPIATQSSTSTCR